MRDTIVIGKDLSSLIAALALARAGRKTILIEDGKAEDCQESSYAFSNNLSPCFSLGSEQTLLNLLKRIHPLPDEAPEFLHLDPAFQIILPEHRIEFFREDRDLVADLIREFPRFESHIVKFYRSVKVYGDLINKWIAEDVDIRELPFKSLMSRFFRFPAIIAGCCSLVILTSRMDEQFKKVILAQLTLLSGLRIKSSLFPLSVAYLLSLPSRGIYYPLGGRLIWMNWLRKGFVEAGGEILCNSSIIRINSKSNVNVDIERSGSSYSLQSKNLIISTQFEKIHLLLGEQKIVPRQNRFLARFEPVEYPLCIHLGVNEECIPEQMAPLTLIIPDDPAPSCIELSTLIVQVSLRGEESRAPLGKRAISITTFLKASPLNLSDTEIKESIKQAIDSLESFLPFLRENIDYIDVEKIIESSRQYHDTVDLKYASRMMLTSGIRNFSTPRTPFPNVFLTGSIMRAGLGFEGEVLSGLDAAYAAGLQSIRRSTEHERAELTD